MKIKCACDNINAQNKSCNMCKRRKGAAMKKLLYKPKDAWVGDLIPYYEDGTYYLKFDKEEFELQKYSEE